MHSSKKDVHLFAQLRTADHRFMHLSRCMKSRWTQTLSSRWMIMGTSLASMTACTCCWLPAVMLDRNHTASYRRERAQVTVFYQGPRQVLFICLRLRRQVSWFLTRQREVFWEITLYRLLLEWQASPCSKWAFTSSLDQNPEGHSESLPSGRDRVLWVGPGPFWGSNHRPGHRGGLFLYVAGLRCTPISAGTHGLSTLWPPTHEITHTHTHSIARAE